LEVLKRELKTGEEYVGEILGQKWRANLLRNSSLGDFVDFALEVEKAQADTCASAANVVGAKLYHTGSVLEV
jgi:hypothetical protein